MAYSKKCEGQASTGQYSRSTESVIKVDCGRTYNGQTQLCDPCQKAAERRYPQGWRYYPGDVCKHGTYVGGCGRDIMCFQCEMGDD